MRNPVVKLGLLEIQDVRVRRKTVRYERFEQLPVWQASMDLAVATYVLTSKTSFAGQDTLRDQLERAAVSVSNNIAEGFERGTNQELLTFLYVARGSAGEVRSMLCLPERLGRFRDLESGILNLKSLAESVSKQLGAWIHSLKDSEMKGKRYVREKTKKADLVRRGREEFLQKLQQLRERSTQDPEAGGAG